MNELDVLNNIASNLTERKSSAALSNYEVLCNNISFTHGLLERGIAYIEIIITKIKNTLSNNNLLNRDYQKNNTLNAFTLLIPSLLLNDLEVIKKLSIYTEPDDRKGINIDNLQKLHRDFIDYNNLATATRQLIDSLVSDAYQIQRLDPKEFNYHVLLSLNSFEKYATKSIRQGLFNEEIEESLEEFRKLSFREWKNSSITKCENITFANKVDYLFSELQKNSPDDILFTDEIKNLFKFTSEFTHIGYISTFFTSQAGSQPIFGSEKGPYLPSTENFSELKYQILETCINFIYQVYLPSIKVCIDTTVLDSNNYIIQTDLNNLIKLFEKGIKTRNNDYYFFVCSSLIDSTQSITLPCLCGYENSWISPHKDSDLFCTGCGSSYNIIGMEGDPGYIFTSNGPIKVIGSSVPDIQDLSYAEQQKLMDEYTKLSSQNK